MTNLEHIRRAKKMTQVELASKCGITQGMISSYENGKTPTIPIGLRIARELGVNLEAIWPEDNLKTDSAA